MPSQGLTRVEGTPHVLDATFLSAGMPSSGCRGLLPPQTSTCESPVCSGGMCATRWGDACDRRGERAGLEAECLARSAPSPHETGQAASPRPCLPPLRSARSTGPRPGARMQPPVWMPAASVPGVEPLARFQRKHRKRQRGGGRAGGQGQVPRGAQKPAGSHFARLAGGCAVPRPAGEGGVAPSPVRAVTRRRPPPGRAPLLSRVGTQSRRLLLLLPLPQSGRLGLPHRSLGFRAERGAGSWSPLVFRGQVLAVGPGGLPHRPLGRRASSLGHFGRD